MNAPDARRRPAHGLISRTMAHRTAAAHSVGKVRKQAPERRAATFAGPVS